MTADPRAFFEEGLTFDILVGDREIVELSLRSNIIEPKFRHTFRRKKSPSACAGTRQVRKKPYPAFSQGVHQVAGTAGQSSQVCKNLAT